MPEPLTIRGRPAAPGLRLGRVMRLATASFASRNAGSVDAEQAALGGALEQAIIATTALLEHQSGDAADMLEFQLAMLSDEALSMPATAAIAAGHPADMAWTWALDTEIADYKTSPDAYFRARASDLVDIRDRVLGHLAGAATTEVIPAGAIVIADDLSPSRFLETDWSGSAIALHQGSASSHVAMLARSRGVPMVVDLGPVEPAADADALLDGTAGTLIINPDAGQRQAYRDASERAGAEHLLEAAALARPAVTADGRRIRVMVNIASVDELDFIDPAHTDGIGLMRSEFLFRDGAPLPDEATQYQAYCRFIAWAGGRPVTIRTLDIGGDKPISGLTPDGESNPFLGVRGVRLTLARPDVFRVQLRALARAAVQGPLKVMWPMVSMAHEHAEASRLMDTAIAELTREGIACARPQLGIMVEVPAAAIAPQLLGEVGFYSIGSNDLTQYVFAAARDLGSVSALNDAGHPAVLSLIDNVARHGRARSAEVSVCGDMASDPLLVAKLIAAGIDTLSVAPAALGRVKQSISTITG